jgi:hypothetical protein
MIYTLNKKPNFYNMFRLHRSMAKIALVIHALYIIRHFFFIPTIVKLYTSNFTVQPLDQ